MTGRTDYMSFIMTKNVVKNEAISETIPGNLKASDRHRKKLRISQNLRGSFMSREQFLRVSKNSFQRC